MPMPSPMPPSCAPSSSGHGGTLVTLDGRPLPLRRADLRVRACGGLARTVLEQQFVNPHAEPLRVTYTLPLPADGAVSGFRFQIDERVIVGEVDRRSRARERFEEALVHGHSAALVEQERSSVFTQEVGNIPPGATVIAILEIDQPLAWRSDAGQGSGGWEYRFPTVVAPRYLGAEGRVAAAPKLEVAVADRRRPIAMSLLLSIDEPLAAGGLPASPSHALSLVEAGEACTVGLADGSAALDRDVVVRWPVAAPQVGLHIDVARPASERATAGDAFGLVTLVPPQRRPAAVPRDLIVLLDTSGSMHGEPLMQAQRITCALIDGLTEQDHLELIEFSTAARRFHRKPLPASAKHRAKAIAWVHQLRASGGTEMRTGIMEALAGLRAEAQRQIVLITDGQIGFEHEVLGEIAERLPPGSRVHTVGVGSAVNRSLTQAAARAGRGLELIVGIGEDPEAATVRLLARTSAPLVVDLELHGEALCEHAPLRLPDLFAGAPALIAARLRPEGGTLRVRGRTAHGVWEAHVHAPARMPGEGSPAVVALFGREQVEDLELRHAAGGDARAIDREIEALGVRFQIATRLTSWIAVSDEATVDPGDPTRHEDVPQELAYGMSVEGLGLRPVGGSSGGTAAAPLGAALRSRSRAMLAPGAAAPPPPMAPRQSAPPKLAKSEAAPLREQVDKETAKKRKADYALPEEPMRSFSRARDADEADDEADDEAYAVLAAFDTDDGLERADAADLDPGGAAPTPSLGTLPARIVLHRDGRLVVEIEVSFALAWRPPASLLAFTGDGETVLIPLQTPGTTAAAALQPGMRLRLVLELPDGMPVPQRLELELDDGLLTIAPLG